MKFCPYFFSNIQLNRLLSITQLLYMHYFKSNIHPINGQRFYCLIFALFRFRNILNSMCSRLLFIINLSLLLLRVNLFEYFLLNIRYFGHRYLLCGLIKINNYLFFSFYFFFFFFFFFYCIFIFIFIYVLFFFSFLCFLLIFFFFL